MTHCCECCECTSRNNRTHIHTAQTHSLASTQQAVWRAIHNSARVCVYTSRDGWEGAGGSQRADGVNGRVNCVSGGSRREVALPPGNTKRPRPTRTHTFREEEKKNHHCAKTGEEASPRRGTSRYEELDWNKDWPCVRDTQPRTNPITIRQTSGRLHAAWCLKPHACELKLSLFFSYRRANEGQANTDC